MTARAKTAAACDASVKAHPTPSLRALANRAVQTADALSALNAQPREAVTDYEYCRADEAAFDAKQALLACLLVDHNIPRELAYKLGGVL